MFFFAISNALGSRAPGGGGDDEGRGVGLGQRLPLRLLVLRPQTLSTD